MIDEPTAPNLPSFVKDRPASDAARWPAPLCFFDYWKPDRSGSGADDFELGKRYCDEALAYARAAGDRWFLPNVMASITSAISRGADCSSLECGFFDRVSRLATYGTPPAPISDIEIDVAVSSDVDTAENLRGGEADARATLDSARLHNCPDAIFGLLVDLAFCRPARAPAAQAFVIAGAALSGSSN